MTDGEGAKPTFEQKLEKSTQLKTVVYDETTHELHVIFRTGQGWLYVYSGVPPETWRRFQAADSPGSFHHYEIKGKYAFDKRLAPQPGMFAGVVDPSPLPQTED